MGKSTIFSHFPVRYVDITRGYPTSASWFSSLLPIFSRHKYIHDWTIGSPTDRVNALISHEIPLPHGFHGEIPVSSWTLTAPHHHQAWPSTPAMLQSHPPCDHREGHTPEPRGSRNRGANWWDPTLERGEGGSIRIRLTCIGIVRQFGYLHLIFPFKSAHTALAVKACLLGAISYTKCSMRFVNIAVAISALAGGGAKNDFAPRPQKINRVQPLVVFS